MNLVQFQRRVRDLPVTRDADHVAVLLPWDMVGMVAPGRQSHHQRTPRGLVLGYKKETLGEMAVDVLVGPSPSSPLSLKKIALFRHMLGDEWQAVEQMAEMVRVGWRAGGPGITAAELQTGVIIDGPTI